MKPFVSILMVTSIDGSLHPSRFTTSPDGTRQQWTAQYEKVHASLKANAWLVGRVTMAEMSKAGTHAPPGAIRVERPLHVANKGAGSFGIAMDWSGKLHFKGGMLSGDHVIVLLGPHVPDSHLAELAEDGVSYFISAGKEFDVPALLETLNSEFGISHLVVEGGAATNGAFLAAQVVDELRILIAPALEGASQVQGIVAYRDGLAGLVKLQFKAATSLENGVVELRYAVTPA